MERIEQAALEVVYAHIQGNPQIIRIVRPRGSLPALQWLAAANLNVQWNSNINTQHVQSNDTY